MAPDADPPASLSDDTSKRPFVVTFYSFKGGVGRTTALAFLAGMLAARDRRVIMLDFDLEAPGLSLMFPAPRPGGHEPTVGVVDYLYQRYLTPAEAAPDVADCIQRVELDSRGELFLLRTGEYDENYIHRLADLDVRLLYGRDRNPIYQLLEDVKAEIDPDLVLIDARTGFDETGAVALLDLADLGVICFSPTDQTFSGLQWVVQAARKQRDRRGIPDLRFLLTPMPPVAPTQRQLWIAQVEDWIATHWGVPSDMSVGDLYSEAPYNPTIATLTSLVNDVQPGVLDPYTAIADAIDASLLPVADQGTRDVQDKRKRILTEIQFRAATAQEMSTNDIPAVFQRTGDFPRFLEDRTWLIRGAKGTGKSLLFRLFVETPPAAVQVAAAQVDLRGVRFVPAHGRPELRSTILTRLDLASYEDQAGKEAWEPFWLNYALLQLCSALRADALAARLDAELVAICQASNPLHADIVAWLVRRATSPQAMPQAVDELRLADKWLSQRGEAAWLFYDELDVGFGQDYACRRRALEALFLFWLESGPGLEAVTPKVLLREDIWMGLNFTNQGHYMGRAVQLRWDEVDLWRLILRQALNSSATLVELLRRGQGIELERLDSSSLEQLRVGLSALWGKRMGGGKKAYTYNWVRNRITDSQKNRFPRSLIVLLHEATELERRYPDASVYEAVLRPRALIEALPDVSNQRVEEVRNEYPEFAEDLAKLEGERSPIPVSRLGEIWGRQGADLAARVADMAKAGILQEYLRSPDLDVRYAVAELYLYGLRMTRMGQK